MDAKDLRKPRPPTIITGLTEDKGNVFEAEINGTTSQKPEALDKMMHCSLTRLFFLKLPHVKK